jgi:hypothetical protein
MGRLLGLLLGQSVGTHFINKYRKKGSCWERRHEEFTLWMKDFDMLLSAKTLLDVLECCVNIIFDQENWCLAQISFCLAQILWSLLKFWCVVLAI